MRRRASWRNLLRWGRIALYKERGRQAAKPQCIKVSNFQETRWETPGEPRKGVLSEMAIFRQSSLPELLVIALRFVFPALFPGIVYRNRLLELRFIRV
jgi:hypothetical protein